MSASTGRPLSGVTVLVTRPGEQGADLVKRLEVAGGNAVYLPLIEIDLMPDSVQLQSALGDMTPNTMLVFVSVHAVRSFARACANLGKSVPKQVCIAAVGAATSQALRDSNLEVDFVPVGEMNSEGLLAMLEKVDLGGKKVQIYRGQSGRTLLTEVFRARGAIVAEIECYRRRRIDGDLSHRLMDFARAETRVITLTSVEFVQTLAMFLQGPHADAIVTSPLAVLSHRIAGAAAAAGFLGKVAVAPATSNAGLVEAVKRIVVDPD